MINIKTLEFRNFQTYGDYVTKLPISDIGPALIVGTDEDVPGRRNGVGKTGITEAIVWCLFGRLTKKDKPGDNIVNWNIGKDCYVEIETKCGHKITRTRKMANHSDLLITKPDGTDISSSTNPNAQGQLSKLFNLDYDIFSAGTFFGQFGEPLMELSEQKRRAVLEKMLHISHLDVYASVAKKKREWAESQQEQEIFKKNNVERSIRDMKSQIEENQDNKDNFEIKRTGRISRIDEEIAETQKSFELKMARSRESITSLEEEISQIKIPSLESLEKLKKRWELVGQIELVLSDKNTESLKLRANISSLEREQKKLEAELEKWSKKVGTICSQCRQEVSDKHIRSQTDPIQDNQMITATEIRDSEWAIKTIEKEVETISKKLESARPKQTVDHLEAEISIAESNLSSLNSRKEQIVSSMSTDLISKDDQVKKMKGIQDDIVSEQNPYGKIISDLEGKMKDRSEEISGYTSKIKKLDTLINHLSYIHSAYKDRKKIKSFILSKSIPFFNKQIAYYIDSFNLGLSIKFNTYLQATTSKWPHWAFSGGEGKRADLAIMFGIHDLHASMYGTMSNILVFDEVDGRLCPEGIEGFLRILFDDIIKEGGPETVLVVSHRDEMRDAFPTKIEIVKRGGFSYISDIR